MSLRHGAILQLEVPNGWLSPDSKQLVRHPLGHRTVAMPSKMAGRLLLMATGMMPACHRVAVGASQASAIP